MPFGSKLPYQDVTVVNAVGNSPNAAVGAHRLGLETALITNVGHDGYGKDCRKGAFRTHQIQTDIASQSHL